MMLYSCEDSTGREWVTVLSEAVQQAVDKRKTLRKDSSSRRPLRRPALRKLTIKGDVENILPLKVGDSLRDDHTGIYYSQLCHVVYCIFI